MERNLAGADTWRSILSDCITAAEREQIGSKCPVVDHEVLSPNGGNPEDICVFLICRSKEEKQLFSDTEHGRFASELSRRLLQAGFPESALTSLSTQVTSREEIEAAGGRISLTR